MPVNGQFSDVCYFRVFSNHNNIVKEIKDGKLIYSAHMKVTSTLMESLQTNMFHPTLKP